MKKTSAAIKRSLVECDSSIRSPAFPSPLSLAERAEAKSEDRVSHTELVPTPQHADEFPSVTQGDHELLCKHHRAKRRARVSAFPFSFFLVHDPDVGRSIPL